MKSTPSIRKSIKMVLKISDDIIIKVTTDELAAYKNALGKVLKENELLLFTNCKETLQQESCHG